MPTTREYAVTDLLSVARAGRAWAFGPDGVLAEAAPNTLRQDYDPLTLAYRGLLAEPASANPLRNVEAAGSVPGVSGSMPTYWAIAPGGQLSYEIGTGGMLLGHPALDVRFFGTAAAASFPTIYFEQTTSAPAVQNDQIAWSFWQQHIAGSLPNSAQFANLVQYSASGVSLGALSPSPTRPAPKAVPARYSGIVTVAAADTAFIRPSMSFQVPAGAWDFTLRVGLPQMEKAAASSSIILSGGTRAADDITMSDISRWFSPDQGTIVVDFMPSEATSGDREILMLDDGTASNRIRLSMIAGGTTVRLRAIIGGVIAGTVTMPSGPALTRHTARWSYGPAGMFLSVNGAAPVSVAVPVPPALRRAFLGNAVGGNHLNGWLGPRVQHYPVQYTDAPGPDGYTIRNR